jgi:hypothetical protein
MRSALQNSFRIGEVYRVEPSLNSVTGPAGAIRLEPKVMQVLVCLAVPELLSRGLQVRALPGAPFPRNFGDFDRSHRPNARPLLTVVGQRCGVCREFTHARVACLGQAAERSPPNTSADHELR